MTQHDDEWDDTKLSLDLWTLDGINGLSINYVLPNRLTYGVDTPMTGPLKWEMLMVMKDILEKHVREESE